MRIDIITLFPSMFSGPLTESILKRAQDNGLLELYFHDLRAFGKGKYRQIDDKPYGGGAGMLMMCEPVVGAIEKVTELGAGIENNKKATSYELRATSNSRSPKPPLTALRTGSARSPYRIYLSPRGARLTQSKVEKMAKKHEWLILLCGHYEGIDQRIIDGGWIDEEVSIGDYVLTGGELPAMVLIDAISRHIPGVLGKDESAHDESFSASLGRKKEYPHYTRPEEFRGLKVPETLLSGHHKEIEKWRKKNVK